jgi:Fe-S oxidoreductase
MFIEHVDAIVDMRRFLTLEKGQTPGQGSQVIDNLIATDNPNGYNPTHRMNWAADQNLPLMKDVKRTQVLLWMGDAAFDMRGQRTLRAVVKLLRSANVEFAVLGNEEKDSGDLARRLGDEATFQRLANANIATLRQYHFDMIVTADPHSFHVIGNEYGELGGKYKVLHHTTFMNELSESGRLHLKDDLRGKVTYHDPCYLGRYNGEFEAPRSLLKSMGADLVEMERSNFRSRCCGGGGAAPITDIPGEKRIPDMRIDDANATGAEIVAVACPQCALMLEGVVTPRPEVKDIAELLVEQLVVMQEPAESNKPAPAEVQ